MKLRRTATTLAALGLATAITAPAAMASTTSTAKAKPLGNTSLASVLTKGGVGFDRNWYDYDILTKAVLTVLDAKPGSDVSVLTKGDVALTAFIPNDRAFQVLVYDLTKKWVNSEQGVFDAVAGLGVDTIESVLLYHVVPGATIDSKAAVKANGATLDTALTGKTIKVKVYSKRLPLIVLKDKDTNDVNPIVNPRALDINKGNKQIAHGLVFVLRPVDL